MRKSIATVTASLLVLFTANFSAAQQQEYWIELESHTKFENAVERARQLERNVPEIRGIRTGDGRFVLVLGKYGFDEGRKIRIALSAAQSIPVTSRLNPNIDVAGFFWPPANRRLSGSRATGIQQTQDEVGFDNGDKLAIQTALQWFGHYSGKIDAIFGSGTARAIADFQMALGIEPTGILTRDQANQLLDAYNSETAMVELLTVEDTATGISISIPQSLVKFAAYDAPFVHYEPTSREELNLYLISMAGGRSTLNALFEILRNSDFLPDAIEHETGRRHFRIRGQDENRSSQVLIRLTGNRLKGFALTWNREHDPLVQRIAAAMSASFRESHDGTLDPELSENRTKIAADLLEILPRRQIANSASGFFINHAGLVATTAAIADGCTEISVRPSEPMTVRSLDASLGLAILAPVNPVSPLSHAQFSAGNPVKGKPVMVTGYSYRGELGSPTVTIGSWIGDDLLAGNADLAMIEAPVLPGDAGGPVIDGSGNVIGMLRSRIASDRILPEGIHHLVATKAIRQRANDTAEPGGPSDPNSQRGAGDTASRARNMTVLVECYGRE